MRTFRLHLTLWNLLHEKNLYEGWSSNAGVKLSVIIKKMMSFRLTWISLFKWSKIVFHSGKRVVLWLEVEVKVIWTDSQVENEFYKFVNEFLDSNWWMDGKKSLRVHSDFAYSSVSNSLFYQYQQEYLSRQKHLSTELQLHSLFCPAKTWNATFLTIFYHCEPRHHQQRLENRTKCETKNLMIFFARQNETRKYFAIIIFKFTQVLNERQKRRLMVEKNIIWHPVDLFCNFSMLRILQKFYNFVSNRINWFYQDLNTFYFSKRRQNLKYHQKLAQVFRTSFMLDLCCTKRESI